MQRPNILRRATATAVGALILSCSASLSAETVNDQRIELFGDSASTSTTPSMSVPVSMPASSVSSVNASPSEQPRDLWGRIRQGYEIPELTGPLVQEHEQWYAKRPDYVARMTDRSKRYLFHVVEELERRKMPLDLALLPFAESAFNPTAVSVAKASGMWQFMPATGLYFNLKQNFFFDQRRDVLHSTRAALDYLSKLHDMFGDWHLALAAYNWGEGNVQKAIARNERLGLPTDYMSLSMPDETRSYVPKLQAIKNLIASPDVLGLTLPDLPNHPYFVTVKLDRDMDVELAAKLAGLSVDEFKALNPAIRRPVIVAKAMPEILVPYDHASVFEINALAHEGPTSSLTATTLPKTMRLGDAARHLGVDVDWLQNLHRIPLNMLIKAGSTLLVPRGEQKHHDVTENVALNGSLELVPEPKPVVRRSLVSTRSYAGKPTMGKNFKETAAKTVSVARQVKDKVKQAVRPAPAEKGKGRRHR